MQVDLYDSRKTVVVPVAWNSASLENFLVDDPTIQQSVKWSSC